jgi:hypothetical protein
VALLLELQLRVCVCVYTRVRCFLPFCFLCARNCSALSSYSFLLLPAARETAWGASSSRASRICSPFLFFLSPFLTPSSDSCMFACSISVFFLCFSLPSKPTKPTAHIGDHLLLIRMFCLASRCAVHYRATQENLLPTFLPSSLFSLHSQRCAAAPFPLLYFVLLLIAS